MYVVNFVTMEPHYNNNGLITVVLKIMINILVTFAKLREATISFVMSAYMSVRLSTLPHVLNNSAPTRRIFMKFDIWSFFKNISRNFKFH